MLKKRLIFTLHYDHGFFMLSRNFRLQKVGDINWLQENYNFKNIAYSIDELIILDVSRSDREIARFCHHIKEITRDCFVPVAAGGGISTIGHAQQLLRSGADKIVLNTSIAENPDLVRKLASNFGSQCIIASVDVKKINADYYAFTHNGQKKQVPIELWINKVSELPVGEVYLNSMDRDGTGQGYDLAILNAIDGKNNMPVILAGGVGNHLHLSEGLTNQYVDAVATANLFNFVGDGLQNAREKLITNGLDLVSWNSDLCIQLKHYF